MSLRKCNHFVCFLKQVQFAGRNLDLMPQPNLFHTRSSQFKILYERFKNLTMVNLQLALRSSPTLNQQQYHEASDDDIVADFAMFDERQDNESNTCQLGDIFPESYDDEGHTAFKKIFSILKLPPLLKAPATYRAMDFLRKVISRG
jgi:hypothetical protein